MGRPKKEINFWGISDMIEYARKIYPTVNDLLNDNIINEEYRKLIYQQISRTLKAYKLIVPNKDEKTDKYMVAEEIAKFVIETILQKYFTENKEKVSEKLKQLSQKIDEQLNSEQEQLFILGSEPYYDFTENNTKEIIDSNSELVGRFDEHMIHKRYYEYHIPQTTEDNITYNFADEIIDRMMIRAIFDIFYDFNEIEFRKDLLERARCISNSNDSSVRYTSGYSALTQKLENPIGNYVFPKKKDGNRS